MKNSIFLMTCILPILVFAGGGLKSESVAVIDQGSPTKMFDCSGVSVNPEHKFNIKFTISHPGENLNFEFSGKITDYKNQVSKFEGSGDGKFDEYDLSIEETVADRNEIAAKLTANYHRQTDSFLGQYVDYVGDGYINFDFSCKLLVQPGLSEY